MIALGKEQETARGFEIERLAARSERADHDSARRIERLLGCPQTFLALCSAHEDETAGIEPELREPRRVRGAVFGEDALLACPNHPGLACPAGGEPQAKADGGRLRARPSRTQLMQGLARHGGGHAGKTGGYGGWTGSHVLYMFYTPDSY